VQDPDVLDTWFSSWLWTFSPLGWPEPTDDLRRFHPTSVMVTAADIIFFWVARMIMASYEFLREPPFREVIFTGLVRDDKGRKMSKSLGNSPDPISLIDQYGADALRCSLVMLTPTGQDIHFSEASLEVGRNFCNKIFQATKLVLNYWEQKNLPSSAEDGPVPPPGLLDLSAIIQSSSEEKPAAAIARIWQATFGSELPLALADGDLRLEDYWILGRLCTTAGDCYENMERRRLNDALYSVFNFFRHELCDWYLEAIKPRLRDSDQCQPALVVAVLGLALSYKLLHPGMPFITEELWSWLPPSRGHLMTSSYPVYRGGAPFAGPRERFEQVKEIVSVVRNLRNELGVPPGKRGQVILRVPETKMADTLANDLGQIELLAKLDEVQVTTGGDDPSPAGVDVAGVVEVFLLMTGLVDVEKERNRLEKELAKIDGWLQGCRAKLANEKFTSHAPEDVVQRQRDLLVENEQKAERLQRRLKAL
jgi:valyl-tRNA synthetase